MAENKTQPTQQSVQAFLEAVPHPVRRADGLRMAELMARVSGFPPVLWGPSIVGFGSVHYKYESGREGDICLMGFSPRKANLVLYLKPGLPKLAGILERLGRHTTGKGCIYLTNLADVDPQVLEELLRASL